MKPYDYCISIPHRMSLDNLTHSENSSNCWILLHEWADARDWLESHWSIVWKGKQGRLTLGEKERQLCPLGQLRTDGCGIARYTELTIAWNLLQLRVSKMLWNQDTMSIKTFTLALHQSHGIFRISGVFPNTGPGGRLPCIFEFFTAANTPDTTNKLINNSLLITH